MNNLPLQPLVWDSQNYTQSAFHQYLVRKDGEARKNSKSQYEVAYGRINTQQSFDVATGFATIDEAKAWAWNHYNEKMQPYVKPAPTWIDASERLPEKHTTVLVVYHAHFDDEPITEFDVCTAFFDGETFDPKDQLFYQKRNTTVTQWMPIPEFSTMQNLNKGE